MTHALKFHDKYYVLFKEVTISNYGGYEKRWLYIFSQGEVEKKVEFPQGLDVTYLDFFRSQRQHNSKTLYGRPYFYFRYAKR